MKYLVLINQTDNLTLLEFDHQHEAVNYVNMHGGYIIQPMYQRQDVAGS